MVTSRVYGQLSTGATVTEHTLTNRTGMILKILDYGGIITELHVPDRDGQLADVVLGYDELTAYEENPMYFGAITGRYAGRIAKGRFTIHDADVTLLTNNGDNHLHGGARGFDKVIWDTSIGESAGALILNYTSRDGEEGYPGNLAVRVIYELTDDDELRVEYFATTDAPTVLNLTQHSYFNLSGRPGSDILNHDLQVNADSILELDNSSLPTGAFRPVEGSPFDFRTPKSIARDIGKDDPQLLMAKGYDHNWVLSASGTTVLAPAAVLQDATSGRRMAVHTTQPGIQIYTSNYLDGTVIGKAGHAYGKHAAICLETQHFPDSPNHGEFPSTLLEPGEQFRSVTVFRFSSGD